MNPTNFFGELKRRNVYKVAIAYAVVAWLLIQAASILFPTFEAPTWVMKVFVTLLALGFLIALIIAWAFEMTPQGMKRTEEVSPDEFIPQWSRRKFAAFIAIVAVIAAGLLAYQFMGPGAVRAPAKSIAVLPFENLSGDPDNAYFTEGVQDEILTRLAKIADLKVISRTSTQHYKSSPDDLPQIAKRLGVSNILEGSVQKAADRVRVSVQLINAANDAHLWAETYDRKLTDIFAVESEVAKTIAETLRAKLTGLEQHAIAVRPTDNTEAHQLYLKGRFFWNKRTAPNLTKSIEYFDQAIEKDPNYALAYAGLADAWTLLPGYGGGKPSDCFPKAEAAARKALELDETLAEAHASLGQFLAAYEFDVPRSIKEFERAIELNPNYPTAHQWLGDLPLLVIGQFDRAIAELKRAVELDPLSLIINADLGAAYITARRLDEGIAQLRKTLEMDPNFYYARYNLAQALVLKGATTEALDEYQKALRLQEDPVVLALLGHLYAMTGKQVEARKILDQQSRPILGSVAQRPTFRSNRPENLRAEITKIDKRIDRAIFFSCISNSGRVKLPKSVTGS